MLSPTQIFPVRPMEWNNKTYREHIESVLSCIEEYKGKVYQLAYRPDTNDYWFGHVKSDFPDAVTKIMKDHTTAVTYFMSMNPLPKLG